MKSPMRIFLAVLPVAVFAAGVQLVARASGVGTKLEGIPIQLRAAFIRIGQTNGIPIAISKDGVVLNNPRDLPLPTSNEIPSIAESKRIVADWLASRTNSFLTSTNR